jgi:hypothetical protein
MGILKTYFKNFHKLLFVHKQRGFLVDRVDYESSFNMQPFTNKLTQPVSHRLLQQIGPSDPCAFHGLLKAPFFYLGGIAA